MINISIYCFVIFLFIYFIKIYFFSLVCRLYTIKDDSTTASTLQEGNKNSVKVWFILLALPLSSHVSQEKKPLFLILIFLFIYFVIFFASAIHRHKTREQTRAAIWNFCLWKQQEFFGKQTSPCRYLSLPLHLALKCEFVNFKAWSLTGAIAGGITGATLGTVLSAILIYKWRKKQEEECILGKKRNSEDNYWWVLLNWYIQVGFKLLSVCRAAVKGNIALNLIHICCCLLVYNLYLWLKLNFCFYYWPLIWPFVLKQTSVILSNVQTPWSWKYYCM